MVLTKPREQPAIKGEKRTLRRRVVVKVMIKVVVRLQDEFTASSP